MLFFCCVVSLGRVCGGWGGGGGEGGWGSNVIVFFFFKTATTFLPLIYLECNAARQRSFWQLRRAEVRVTGLPKTESLPFARSLHGSEVKPGSAALTFRQPELLIKSLTALCIRELHVFKERLRQCRLRGKVCSLRKRQLDRSRWSRVAVARSVPVPGSRH